MNFSATNAEKVVVRQLVAAQQLRSLLAPLGGGLLILGIYRRHSRRSGARPPLETQDLGETEMKKLSFTWMLPALIVALVSIGCSQETSRKDVAAARDKVQKEQQQTADTIHQGQQDIATAQQKAQEHTVAK